MAFRIHLEETVEGAVRRIAREQIDKAIAEIEDRELDRDATVHQVRKRCKKIRGLLRLVRAPLEETYATENAHFRDAARRLSGARDSRSIIETLDALTAHYRTPIDREPFVGIRRQLEQRAHELTKEEIDLDARLDAVHRDLCDSRKRVSGWSLGEEGFAAVASGLARTYGRARRSLRQAYADPSAVRFHDWRKRVKYHWYHMRLLRELWDEPLKARRDEADGLSDLLGDDHDLAVLRETLLQYCEAGSDVTTLEACLGLISQRQMELRTRARTLGARLFAEKTKQHVKRLDRYWQAACAESRTAPELAYAPGLQSR